MILADLHPKRLIYSCINVHPIHQVAKAILELRQPVRLLQSFHQMLDRVSKLRLPLWHRQFHQRAAYTQPPGFQVVLERVLDDSSELDRLGGSLRPPARPSPQTR